MLARLSQGRSCPGGAGGPLLVPLLLGLTMMMMMMAMEATSVEEVESEESQEILEEDEAFSSEILVRIYDQQNPPDTNIRTGSRGQL